MRRLNLDVKTLNSINALINNLTDTNAILELENNDLKRSSYEQIRNLTEEKACLEKENKLLRKSNWALTAKIRNLTNTVMVQPDESQIYKPCKLSDGGNCNDNQTMEKVSDLVWTQNGYTLTDPSIASDIHLNPIVVANKTYYGNNPKEHFCIYKPGVNISFVDGTIEMFGDLNKIHNSSQLFHIKWALQGIPLTDPQHDSLVVIRSDVLKVLVDSYNRNKPQLSYPKIKVFQTEIIPYTSLARDITPVRNPNRTIDIIALDHEGIFEKNQKFYLRISYMPKETPKLGKYFLKNLCDLNYFLLFVASCVM